MVDQEKKYTAKDMAEFGRYCISLDNDLSERQKEELGMYICPAEELENWPPKIEPILEKRIPKSIMVEYHPRMKEIGGVNG